MYPTVPKKVLAVARGSGSPSDAAGLGVRCVGAGAAAPGPVAAVATAAAANRFASPKSMILTSGASSSSAGRCATSTFSSFKSRCMTPCWCMYATAHAICRTMAEASASLSSRSGRSTR